MARFICVTDRGFKAYLNVEHILTFQDRRKGGSGDEDYDEEYNTSNCTIELSRGIFNLWEVEETVDEIRALLDDAGPRELAER